MIPAITALYASVSGFLMILLAWRVVRQRHASQVGVGDGGAVSLQRAIRVHGNFAEYVPFALLLLLIAELCAAAPAWLHANGIALLVARALHGWGLSRHSGKSFGRFWGTALTWLVILALSATVLLCAASELTGAGPWFLSDRH